MGDLRRIGYHEDAIELEFDGLSGSAAADFGASALALIEFLDPIGLDPFAALSDGDTRRASITVSSVVLPAAIPLPAGLPLVLTGLGGLILIRRRLD